MYLRYQSLQQVAVWLGKATLRHVVLLVSRRAPLFLYFSTFECTVEPQGRTGAGNYTTTGRFERRMLKITSASDEVGAWLVRVCQQLPSSERSAFYKVKWIFAPSHSLFCFFWNRASLFSFLSFINDRLLPFAGRDLLPICRKGRMALPFFSHPLCCIPLYFFFSKFLAVLN